MSSTVRRGFLYFGILVFVVAFVCIGPAFFWLPQLGAGVPLPVIALPGEVLVPNWPVFGYDFTNTLTSLVLVDLVILAIAFVVWRATAGKDPATFVPRGFTNFIELITEFLYNQARSMLGVHTSRVFPLAASIFLFLLIANWVKLVPGVESVGIISCAEPGYPGYPLHDNQVFLNVNSLDLSGRAGIKATADDTHACEEKYPQFIPPLEIAKEQRAEAAGETGEHAAPEAEPTGEATGEATPNVTGSRPAADVAASYSPEKPSTTTEAAEGGNPDLFVVVPFFRALATDLNLPIALAIIVVFMVQVWGVQVLGGSYFFKFINIPALGNLQKKPLGAIDFLVGLVEIISEISRIISLSFRLFGNIFAGGVLLIVMTFLVAGVLPSIFYFLEIFVGLIQAYVFAILTIIYASQAVVSHHGDEEEGHGGAHGESQHGEQQHATGSAH